jgi:hypothetical protein
LNVSVYLQPEPPLALCQNPRRLLPLLRNARERDVRPAKKPTGRRHRRRHRTPPPAPVRKRPRPGERRVQILQTLAAMLEQPGAERITTAALAARWRSAKPRCTATSPARRRCSKG